MPTATDVLNVARSRLGSDGTTEVAWFGDPRGTPWCEIFTSYVLFHAGFTSLPGESTAKGFSYVPAMTAAAKANGLWRTYPTVPQPGWNVVYIWHHVDDGGDHTGLVEYVDSAGSVHTIEGNSGYPPLVERHVIGPYGDRPFADVLGYVAWPLTTGGPPPPMVLAPEFIPPIVMGPVVARDFNPSGPGMRLLTDDGHVFDFGLPHVGAPAEDPKANWASGGRHGAKIVNNTKGGFTAWDTFGEQYHYGPQ